MAGIQLPADTVIDGVDLMPRLASSDDSVEVRTAMPYYRGGELRAWRTGPWKLHLIIEGAYGVGPEKQVLEKPALYHLGRDPAERFDVADQNPEVVAQIQAAIEAHKAQLSSLPPLFDARLAEHLPPKKVAALSFNSGLHYWRASSQLSFAAPPIILPLLRHGFGLAHARKFYFVIQFFVCLCWNFDWWFQFRNVLHLIRRTCVSKRA